jgi:hypothetical protein
MRKTFQINMKTGDQADHQPDPAADDQEEIVIAAPPDRESKAGAA